jgi:hypothetical protein
VVLDRVERERGDSLPDKLTWDKFWRHVSSWQLWVYGLMFLCCSSPIYAFVYFIQTILKTMGYTAAVIFLLVSHERASVKEFELIGYSVRHLTCLVLSG